MIYAPVVAALIATLALLLARAFLGPSIFDRALAANAVGTVAMLLLAVIEFYTGRPGFTDLALVYGLLNILGTVAVLKFFRVGDLGEPGEKEEGAA